MTVDKSKKPKNYVSLVIKEWFETKPLRFIRFCRRRGIEKALNQLRDRGVQLGIYSDYPAHEKLEALGIDSFFSTVVSSHDSTVRGFKPHTNGFAVAANRMDLNPSDILYVGDRSEVDGVGAIHAGMQFMMIKRFLNEFK